MSVQLVFNALGTTEYLDHPLGGAATGFDFLLDRFIRARQEAILTWDQVTILCSEQGGESFGQRCRQKNLEARLLVPESPDTAGIMRVLAQNIPETDTLVFLRADAVCANTRLAAWLLEDHRKYRAEFTFAEGYPSGFGVSVADASILPILAGLADRHAIPPEDTELFFSLMKKDVNNFEIETRLSRKDHRLLRISLHPRTLRDLKVCEAFVPLADLEPEAFEDAVQSRQEGLRTLPAYLNVQVVHSCPQVCTWCPHGIEHGKSLLGPGPHMAKEDFMDLCRRFEAFSPDSTVGISLWGEPALHPYIYDILEGFGSFRRLSLVVETSGIGWNPDSLQKLSTANPSWLRWIVSLDTLDRENYAALRGDGFGEALETAHTLAKLFPGKVWVQAVRTTRNEADLPAFVKYWKEKQVPVIIQKYDHFSAALPDLRVSDISPLDRLPCWHIKRDMTVLLDGTVTRCREDRRAVDGLGNVLKEDLSLVWARSMDLYRRDLEGQRDKLCGSCDESYTFNF